LAGYPDNWREISAGVKKAAGWRCEHCGHGHDRLSGHVLTVHHLDADPSNNAAYNLVALCQRCHLHLQRLDVGRQGWLFGMPGWLARRVVFPG